MSEEQEPTEAPTERARRVLAGPQREARARWIGAASLAALMGVVFLAWPQRKNPEPEPNPDAATLVAEDAGEPDAEWAPSLDGGRLVLDLEDAQADPLMAYSGWLTWPDGGVVPRLPATAPHAVRFGAVLFPYDGAEFAPPDAPRRADARQQAEAAIAEAAGDFSRIVSRGASGSADLGLMHRGILEPPVEYVLFTLKVGAIHPEPVDTPRGYWVLKRLR